ncbi:beta strand repeat-containing protein, partial [Termitidicoccus mucosus]
MNINNKIHLAPVARLVSLAISLLSAALACRADVVTFTGGSPSTAVNATVAGGTIAISGGDGSLVLSNGQTLVISDSVSQSAVATLGGKSDITFRAEGDGWAMLNSAGGAYRLLDITPQPVTASATATLNLDRVIVSNAAMNAMFVRVSTASFDLVVNGDFVFSGNKSASSHGGAINWQKAGNLTFTGTAIFDRNTAGGTYLGGALGSTAAGSGTITFENTALFFSNTAASGGAIFTHPGHSLIFKDAAEFKNNIASTGQGGAFYIQSNDTYLGMQKIRFEDDATFDGNRAVAQGGAFSTDDRVIIQFDSTTGTVTLTNNRAGNGSGGAITSGEISFKGGLLTVTGNFGGTATTHAGGGLRAARLLDITGNYNISGNQTMGSGGGVSVGSLLINGGGTLSGNIASVNGGAVNAAGNSTFEIGGGAELSGNTVGGLGGAIYVGGTSRLTLNASAGDIVFSGNKQAATIDSAAVSTGGTLAATGGTNNAVYFASSATLVLNTGSGMAVRFDDPIESASGATVMVTKSGAGTVIFSDHHSNINATTTIEQGEIRLSRGAIYGAANDQGSFVLKTGATLAGNGTVQAGAIEIESGARLVARDSGRLEMASSATPVIGGSLSLGGSGTIAVGAASNLLHASLIDVGADEPAGARTLAIANDLSLENGAAIRLDLYAGNISDKLAALSDLAMEGRASINIGLVETGSFNLVSWETGGLTTAQLDLSFGSGTGQTARNDVQLGVDATAKTLYLTNIVSSLDMAWTGSAGDGIWQSSALESANWSNGGAGNEERYFRNGDLVSFGGAASGTITVAGPGVVVSGMTIEGTADYEFRGTGGITGNTTGVEGSLITATGKLTKKGTGKLVLANTGANSFSGGVEIKGGELAVADGTRLDADITIDDQDGDGAKLSGSGTFGNMVVRNGGVLSIGTSAASSGTITVADLTLDHASLYFDLLANNSSDYLKVTGSALAQSSTIVIGIFTDGTFNLGNFAGIKDQLSVSTAGAARQSGTLYGEGAELFLKTIADVSRVMTWSGTAGGNW